MKKHGVARRMISADHISVSSRLYFRSFSVTRRRAALCLWRLNSFASTRTFISEHTHSSRDTHIHQWTYTFITRRTHSSASAHINQRAYTFIKNAHIHTVGNFCEKTNNDDVFTITSCGFHIFTCIHPNVAESRVGSTMTHRKLRPTLKSHVSEVGKILLDLGETRVDRDRGKIYFPYRGKLSWNPCIPGPDLEENHEKGSCISGNLKTWSKKSHDSQFSQSDVVRVCLKQTHCFRYH